MFGFVRTVSPSPFCRIVWSFTISSRWKYRMAANTTGTPTTNTAIITDPTAFIRRCAPPGTLHTMLGAATMIHTPFDSVQLKGARDDLMITDQRPQNSPEKGDKCKKESGDSIPPRSHASNTYTS